jgi:hypothetical protein
MHGDPSQEHGGGCVQGPAWNLCVTHRVASSSLPTRDQLMEWSSSCSAGIIVLQEKAADLVFFLIALPTRPEGSWQPGNTNTQLVRVHHAVDRLPTIRNRSEMARTGNGCVPARTSATRFVGCWLRRLHRSASDPPERGSFNL